MPAWLARLQSISRPYIQPAYTYNRRGLSDHAPIGFVCTVRTPLPPDLRPVPSFISKHRAYKQAVLFVEE
eukprot:9034024-Karenia_brevis.AAC.1